MIFNSQDITSVHISRGDGVLHIQRTGTINYGRPLLFKKVAQKLRTKELLTFLHN